MLLPKGYYYIKLSIHSRGCDMNRKQTIAIVTIVVFLCGAIGGGFGYYYMHEKGPIYEFNAERDTKVILDLFDQEWHWLIANEGSSPVFYLKYRTPHENPVYF